MTGQCGTDDSLRSRQGEPSDKDGKTPKQRLLPLGEQVIAPADGVSHRLLARRKIAPSARQEWEPNLKVIQQILRLQHLHADGGKLDRQGQSVKTAHNLGNCGGAGSIQVKRGSHGLRPLHKEVDGVSLLNLIGILRGTRVRKIQGTNRKLAFARQAQTEPAGDQEGQLRTPHQQLAQERRRNHNVFEAIQHQEQLRRPQHPGESCLRRFSTNVAQPDCAGNRQTDQVWISD